MNLSVVVLLGVVCGLAGAVPPAFLFEVALRDNKSRVTTVSAGLASIMVSFAMLSLAILVVRLVAQEATFAFGVATSATFLAVWGIESIRGWRAAQAHGDLEGKDE